MQRWEIEVEVKPSGDNDYQEIEIIIFEVGEDQHRSESGAFKQLIGWPWDYGRVIGEAVEGLIGV